MHTNLHLEISQRPIIPREVATSPYFMLCMYILLLSMCLQKLFTIHHCISKIIEKQQSVTDGQHENSIPPQTKFAGDITRIIDIRCYFKISVFKMFISASSIIMEYSVTARKNMQSVRNKVDFAPLACKEDVLSEQ